MNEEDEIQTENQKEKVIADKRYVVKFSKPYEFEGIMHNEIDLNGLVDVSTDDLIAAERIFAKAGGSSATPETTLLYSIILASIVAQLPIEFFGRLSGKESMKIKKVCNYFFLKAE